MSSERSRQDLYSWDTSDQRVYSRSRLLKPHDDIEQWMQKVGKASDDAVGLVLQDKPLRKKQEVTSAVAWARNDDAAYTEAQDLVNQWMADKVHIDDEDLEYFHDLDDFSPRLLKRQSAREVEPSYLPTLEDYEQDDDELVSKIVSGMMERKLASPAQLVRDDEKKQVDPRVKMKLRREQVKVNRERRQRDTDQKKRETQAKKETEEAARKLLLQEQRERELKTKQEEDLIQHEMTRIRKEMNEQRRREQEERLRIKQLEEAEKERQRLEVERRRREGELRKLNEEKSKKQVKYRAESVLEQIQRKEVVRRFQIQRTHFTAWYQLIVERRLKMGKASAMADWKTLSRNFNVWRDFTRKRRMNEEALQHEMEMKEQIVKSRMAKDHYRLALLKRSVRSWQLWIQTTRLQQQIDEQSKLMKQKMETFIESARQRMDEASKLVPPTPSTPAATDRSGTETTRSRPQSTGRTGRDSGRNDSRSTSRPRATDSKRPREPWQVTKRHVYEDLTPKSDLASNAGGESDRSVPETPQTRPKQKTPPTASNFENRFKAQQKALEEQQRMIKEQQRLIEDLKHYQEKQLINQELKTIEMLKTQQEKIEQLQHLRQDSSSSLVETPTNYADMQETPKSEPPSSQRSAAEQKFSKLVKNMEERSKARERSRQERDERQRRITEERLAKIEAEEEDKLRKEQEEKKRKLEELKEKKQIEKKKQLEKESEDRAYQENMKKAEAFYKKYAVRCYGLKPWKKYVEGMHASMRIAERFHNLCVLRRMIRGWSSYSREMNRERNERANEFYRKYLVRHSFHCWTIYRNHQFIEEEKAERFYLIGLRKKAFTVWLALTQDEKIASWEKERIAKEHNTKRMVKNAFREWKWLPIEVKREREKEKRMAELRKRVQSLLPDFGTGTSSTDAS